jgi:hypothetical protein
MSESTLVVTEKRAVADRLFKDNMSHGFSERCSQCRVSRQLHASKDYDHPFAESGECSNCVYSPDHRIHSRANTASENPAVESPAFVSSEIFSADRCTHCLGPVGRLASELARVKAELVKIGSSITLD